MTDLQNWWQPTGIDSGLASTWYDSGPEGADLVQAFANPLTLSIPINGKSSITGVPSSALENATTSMSGAREAWVVIRPHSIGITSRLVYDGLGGTNRQTLFSQTSGNLVANAGTSLTASGGIVDSRVQILRVVVDGTGTGAIYRVTDVASASTPIAAGTIGSGDWAGITVGSGNAGSNSFQGAIAELLRYSALMSPTAVDQTAAYLLSKYPSAAKYNLTPTYLLPLGDSLTQGLLSTSGYSYKEKLFYAFEANDVSSTSTLVFNGSIEQECFHHDGVAGDTIAQIDARAAAAITASSAGVVVLIAGTNDARDAGYNGATAEADYAALLATIYATDPTLPIVLCLAPPMTTVSHNANINDLNSRLVSTVIPGASSTIYTVDPRTAGWTTGAGYTTDGVHPNDAGEAALATVIEAGIRLI
jgi:lysophospholipase L1-like esterase